MLPSLRTWLRKAPQPHTIRVLDTDDNPHTITLTAEARNRWKVAEESVYAAKAASVQCLDKDDKILRAMVLEVDGDGNALDPEEAIEKRSAKIIAGERKELGVLLDRYGDRLNEAFERGAAAASVSQENLVNLVDALAQRYADAMTGFHQVNAKYAQSLVDGTAGDSPNDKLAADVLSMALAKFLGANANKPEAKPNGGKK